MQGNVMVYLEIFQQKLPAHGAAPLLPRGNLFGDERSHSLSLGRRGARCCTVRSPLCAPLCRRFNGGPPLGQVVLWRVASHLGSCTVSSPLCAPLCRRFNRGRQVLPGASRGISCSKTLQARVVSVLGAKRETSTQAANMRSRGNQFWNQRILFIEGHRWFQNSRLRLGA